MSEGDKSFLSGSSCSSCNSTENQISDVTLSSKDSDLVFEEISVQEKFAPNSICFGCGPANKEGLQIKSHRHNGGLLTIFESEEKHQAFPGVINGGIIGSLIDCHGNWTAAMAIMDKNGWEKPQCTVTAQYEIKLKRPTPLGIKLKLNSRVLELGHTRSRAGSSSKHGGPVAGRGAAVHRRA